MFGTSVFKKTKKQRKLEALYQTPGAISKWPEAIHQRCDTIYKDHVQFTKDLTKFTKTGNREKWE